MTSIGKADKYLLQAAGQCTKGTQRGKGMLLNRQENAVCVFR